MVYAIGIIQLFIFKSSPYTLVIPKCSHTKHNMIKHGGQHNAEPLIKVNVHFTD